MPAASFYRKHTRRFNNYPGIYFCYHYHPDQRKESLSQLNHFDFVVTVVIGSILASIPIHRNVTINQGITAFLVLMIMQCINTTLSVHSHLISKYIQASPLLSEVKK